MTDTKDDSNRRKSFFTDENGCVRYNKVCMSCRNECKQSFRAKVVCCPEFDRVEDIVEKDK